MTDGSGLQIACRDALVRVLNGAMAQRGAIRLADADWIKPVAANLVSNTEGDALVARLVDPLIDQAILRLRYKKLPPQAEPVVLNAKGASASGKSSIRNAQRQIATRLGLDWSHFAIISPDYWRKSLIDYDGLGDDYKYAAMLTGQELEIIDKKLDELMAQLGANKAVPHLLIDRFRFDSFQLAEKRGGDSRLLTRFGSRIYLFFLITPPEETVNRAWSRGLETGRYKAVDDLSYHNIEAYAGMPDLFFSWAAAKDRWAHYEFLDNSVPEGTPPRTVAYGRNGHLVIADIDRFCDIARFRHVNTEARRADEIFERKLDIEDAMEILRRACRDLPAVDVLIPGSDQIFAQARNGDIFVDLNRVPKTVPASGFGEFTPSPDRLGKTDPELLGETIGAPSFAPTD